jgi:ABC-2 type transport system ATP-binding protein
MGAARFIGRIGGLAVALGVGAAVVCGPGAAFADTAEGAGTEAGTAGSGAAETRAALRGSERPEAGSRDVRVTDDDDRGPRRSAPGAAADRGDSLPDSAAAVAVAAAVAETEPLADDRAGLEAALDAPAVDIAAEPAPAVAEPLAALIVGPEPAAPQEVPQKVPQEVLVTSVITEVEGGPLDGAGSDPLAPVTDAVSLLVLGAARRQILPAASENDPAALVTSSQAVTADGLSVAPVTVFADGIFQGTLNATSERGLDLTFTALGGRTGGSNGGKLLLNSGPGTPTAQDYTLLPYRTWDDAGAGKASETWQVRVSEVTGFTQFITGIPIIGLLAGPIIDLLQQAPLLSGLLAPIIGASVVATVTANVAAEAPGPTPLAFTEMVTSFDGVEISTNFFPAAGLSAGDSAPTVLNGPGLGSPGDTDPYQLAGTFGTVPGLAVLRDEGYNVITWDPRGEFSSGGVLQLDNPFFEGRDASEIVTWAAQNPLAELDGPDDPAVGMIGGSYGGGIQMVTAATDPRIDAIVPNGNWYSAIDALYPDDVFKSAWAVLLTLDLLQTGARINNQIYEGALTGLLGGFLSETSQAVLASSGPTSLLNQLQAPTLLLQGTVDALFPLDQSVLNAETITANPFGTPVKLGWFCGGHGACLTGTDTTLQAQQLQLFADTLAWLGTYVAGEGQGADAVPVFQWWDQNVDRYTSDLLPFEAGFNKPDPYTATAAGGVLGILPIIGGSGPNSFAFPSNLIFPTVAGNAINVDLTPPVGEQIVGAAQLSFTYRGLGTSNAVYAQFIDNATGQIVGNNVTAVPVTLDGRERTVSIPLNDIAYTVGEGDTLTLQITDWSAIFFNAAIGVVDISDIQVDLPLRAVPL